MKKILLSLMFAAATTATLSAAEFTEGYFTYEPTGETTVKVASVASKDASGAKITEYTIPATVDNNGTTYTVTAIGQYAFRWSDAVKITLPDGIEEFEYGAFNSASSLTSLNMPSSLRKIGDYGLSSTGLTEITFPASLEEIGGSAFFTCKSLKSVTFNEGLKSIGASAFYKAAIETADLPASLEVLEKKAFIQCESLKTVTLHPGITSLGEGTFYGCKSLESVTIPETVKEIGDECFLDCNTLGAITIPASVEEIGTSIIAKTAVTTITVAAGNSKFKTVNGALYGSDMRLIYAVPMKGVSEFAVDKACIGINGGAFWGSNVSKVTLPDGMLAIDDYAFCQSALAEINFPSTLTFIGEQGFASTKLTEVVLPTNMPYVYDGAFAGCTELTKLTIPSGVKMIYNHAFHNDTKLASVTCLGTTAPEIDDVYETYDSPFFGVSTSTPLYIPAGSLASYKAADWGSYFTITETQAATLALVSASPADGTVLGKYADMKVDLTFAEDVTIVKSTPDVYLRKGSEVSGAVIEPDDKWYATTGSDKKSIRIWAADYDSYTMYFTPEEGAEYYLIIPEGVVKNSDGALNERIVIKWNGPSAPKTLAVTSTDPANGAVLPAGYTDMAFNITFADEITILDFGPDAVLREGDATTGKKIEPDLYWKAQKDGDNTLRVWGADYDYFLQSFKINEDGKYYFTLPAGVVKNAAGDKNEEIVIEFFGPESPKVLTLTSTTPADGAVLPAGYADMVFTFTFADDITIIDYGPDAILREGDATTGKKIDPDLYWKAVKDDDQTLRVWGADYDYFTQSFSVKNDTKYYFTLPEGIVKNDAGAKNEQIVIEFSGPEQSSGIDAIENGKAVETDRYDLNGRPVPANTKGHVIIRFSDGTTSKVLVK